VSSSLAVISTVHDSSSRSLSHHLHPPSHATDFLGNLGSPSTNSQDAVHRCRFFIFRCPDSVLIQHSFSIYRSIAQLIAYAIRCTRLTSSVTFAALLLHSSSLQFFIFRCPDSVLIQHSLFDCSLHRLRPRSNDQL